MFGHVYGGQIMMTVWSCLWRPDQDDCLVMFESASRSGSLDDSSFILVHIKNNHKDSFAVMFKICHT